MPNLNYNLTCSPLAVRAYRGGAWLCSLKILMICRCLFTWRYILHRIAPRPVQRQHLSPSGPRSTAVGKLKVYPRYISICFPLDSWIIPAEIVMEQIFYFTIFKLLHLDCLRLHFLFFS